MEEQYFREQLAIAEERFQLWFEVYKQNLNFPLNKTMEEEIKKAEEIFLEKTKEGFHIFKKNISEIKEPVDATFEFKENLKILKEIYKKNLYLRIRFALFDRQDQIMMAYIRSKK